MTKVTLKGHIIVPDLQLEQIKEALAMHIELTRQEKGCLLFEVTQDPNQINKFHVYEEFVDQRSFDYHQERIAESDWGLVSKSLARDYQITGI
jgi:quinol monooxygenase YgiN